MLMRSVGHYAASCGNCLPTFRDNVSVPSSRVIEIILIYTKVGSSVRSSRDSRHMRRRTFATVRHGDPLGKTGLVWKSELYAWGHGKRRQSPAWQHPTSHGTADLEFASKCRLGNVWFIPRTVRIWQQAIFICFPPWRITCQHIVAPAMKASHLLPSRVWRQRDIRSMHPEWTNILHAVTSVSTVKGTVLKNSVLLTSLLCILGFSVLKSCFALLLQ
jgi:hypothetical protein